jgi:hypothetical protein
MSCFGGCRGEASDSERASFRVPRRHLSQLEELLRQQRLRGPFGRRDFAVNEELLALVLSAMRRNAATMRAIQALRERVCQDAESDANRYCVGLNQSDMCDACAIDDVASRMTIDRIRLRGSSASCRVTIACEASGWCAERYTSPVPFDPGSPGIAPPPRPRDPRGVPPDPGETIQPLVVALGYESGEMSSSLVRASDFERVAVNAELRASAEPSAIIALSQGTYSMFPTPLSGGGAHIGAPRS